MDDINLDFLKTPKQSQPVARTPSPFVYNGLDVRFGKKKLGSRKFEMAQSIAKVDELLQEIDKIRSQNNELQLRLKDFQKTAQQVQDLYSKEKREHTIAKQNLEKLHTEYKKIDVDLTNKTMVNDQIKARLAEYEGRPINFNNLVVKYVKIMNKLEGEDILKYSSDKDLVERLREYCAAMKLKIPPVNSPRKHKTRGHKIKTLETFVQCNLLEEISSLQKEVCVSSTNKPKMQDQNTQCSPQNQDWLSSTKKPKMQDQSTQCSSLQKQECLVCTKKPKMHDQNTQCSSTTKRDQASQYISTMITRQTNTEKIIQKHVQTMFPEPQKMPAIDDILNVYSRWSNIRSVSPLLESPSRLRKDISTKTTSIGTCTMLCNIRRKIDYLPPNSSSNIKQEIVTPSASPTPTSNPLSSNRARVSSMSNNVSSNINPSQFSSSILNIFNANTNSALGQLSSNAFNELWQIFGKMLLSLLQSSNAGIAQSNQNSGINQQQFLDWLLELYMSTQPQTTASTQTQTLEQMDSTGSRSPICFNDSSMLSTNIVRPEAQKTLPPRTNTEEDETGDSLRADSSIDNNNTHRIYQRSVAISPIPTSCTSNFPLESYSQDLNSMDREVQQIQIASNIIELQTRCLNESNLNEIHQENTFKEDTKASNKRKTKHKLLDQIQELIPEVNLNKKKRKALKRLLKNKNHRKNSYETRKTKNLNDFKNNSSIVLLSNETDNDETIENAVDFLKTFAATQEENFSETEKIFLEQSSIEMVDERIIENKNVYKSDDEFTFIKPSGIPRTKHASATSKDVFLKPTTKRKQSKTSKTKQIANKYQLLFGDSDSEFEEQEMEMENSKSVIKTQLNLSEGNNNCNNVNESTNPPYPGVVNTTNFKQNKYSEGTNSNDGNSWNQTCHLTIRDPPQKELSLPIIPTPVFENCCDSDYSYDRFSIPDIPTPLLKRLECTHLPEMEQFENTKDFDYLQSAESNNYVDSNIQVCENNIENDLELSSDDSCCHGDDYEIINSLPKTDSNKQIEVPTISQNNTNNFNKSPSGCLLEQTQVIGTQTNEEFCTNTMAKLKETFITAKHLVNKIELNVEKCIKTLPNLNEYDDEENCSNDSIDGAEFSTEPTYPSDFEKDLELSSDNESVISQCDEINTQAIEETEEKDYEFSNSFKTCASNSITEDINSFATCKEERNVKTLQSKNVAEAKDNLLENDINSSSNLSGNESNIINLQQRTDNNFEAITTLSVEVKNSSTTKTIPSNLEQSYSSKNKTASEKNSLCWSVITVSESSINDETLNNEEITKTLETKSNNEVDTTKKGLSSLKLLDLNSIHRHLKESSNVMTNTKPNSSNVKQIRKTENEINLFCSPPKKDIKYQNISVQNNTLRKENDVKLSWSSITADLKTNGNDDYNEVINTSEDYSSMEEECGLKSKEVNLITGFENDLIINKPDTNLTENEMNCNLETPVLKKDLYLSLQNDVSILNKDLISDEPIETEDETDFNDSLSVDNELLIDEEPNYMSAKESETEELNSTKLSETSCESCDDTINSSNISSLLNSTLYNDVLTESLNPIVDDLLKNDVLKKSLATEENKPKRGRKRKSECLAEVVLPCKRSQRLKAKQIILEESINLSKTPIKLGKYTKIRKNLNNIQLNSPCNENIKDTNLKMKCETAENNESLGNAAPLQMGFFRERLIKDLKESELNNHHKSTIAKTNQSGYKSEVISNNILNQAKILDDTNEFSLKNQTTPEFRVADNPSNNTISNKPTDCFVYTDSPQSPPPLKTHQEFLNETFVVIPQERLPNSVPQQYNVTLFDALITTYRTENQKHVLESITTKERQRQENILSQYDKQLKSFCYSEMELDPNCTSIQLINQLLSISPDYSLIQKALITVAQKAEGTNVNENDLPSIIQEMPPRHLSKCLQRLFAVLRNFITRNSNFCLDLIDKIELLLFNWKQTENLSLQATLNVTQLYLMACKVQEYVQLPKHPARLFIAKCLYFYLQKSTLMIHEVLMWYPTVLPHREDKTYDRSDALISVLQHILMTTKYEMEKPDLRGKTLLSKLRYEYHFEPFKPALDEVINVLVEKLKNSKFYNISLAYGLLCKRLGVPRTQHIVLIQHLLPLANEYYNLALTTEDYDKRIAVLLEIISMIVKPFPTETDTKIYFNEFARFLNAFDRQLIQEAALCSILRLQRFNMEYCFKLLRHFQPTYDLNPHTQAMLKTFLHRRPLTYWKNLKSQNPTNLI